MICCYFFLWPIEKAGGAFIWDYLHDNIVDITELPERETHSGYGGYSLSQGDMDDDGVIGKC